ncbi:protein Mpv17 [Aricia agestis]|uniref:protein Mpv17 n=1 Tax=Aricia agestis TaxID=91739 RepID=UPI001C205F90|nr:protein Mpv17 [Aricia agestis]
MRARNIFNFYHQLLHKHPILMQAVQTGLLMGTGDIISQTLIEKRTREQFDFKRTAQFSSIGFFALGPSLRMWYGTLNKYVGSSGKTVALKKVCFDQVIFAPTCLFFILLSVGLMQGKDIDRIKSEMQNNYPDVLITNYYVWPFVQLLNFYFVPLHYQVLLVQTVALFWNTYLSWKTNKTIAID